MIQHGSINEVAAITGFPPSRLRTLVRKGDIASARIGAKYLVTVEAVEHWLKGKQHAEEVDNGEC